MEYTINAGILKGVALAIPKNMDVRNYLNGINVSGTPCGRFLMLEATDGHIMIRSAILDYPSPEKSFVIPRSMVENLKVSQSQKRLPLTITYDGENIGIVWNGATATASTLADSYPETSRIVPLARPSWETSVLDVDLLVRLRKAAALIGEDKSPQPVIGYNGLNATRVLFRGVEDSQFVIMPMTQQVLTMFPDGDLPTQAWANPA